VGVAENVEHAFKQSLSVIAHQVIKRHKMSAKQERHE
jgi:hypothetical protein